MAAKRFKKFPDAMHYAYYLALVDFENDNEATKYYLQKAGTMYSVDSWKSGPGAVEKVVGPLDARHMHSLGYSSMDFEAKLPASVLKHATKMKQNPARRPSQSAIFKKANELMREGYERKQAFAIAYSEMGEPKRNPAPKRKTAARTQRAAVGYVNRPSQITKKAPTKRLKKRRTINLQTPRGVFPNPSPRYNEAKIAWELERTAMGDGFYGNALRVAKDLPGIAAKDRALLDRYATGNQRGTDHVALQDLAMKIDMKARKNPSSVHFDIDVNSHNARGAKAKTRVNPSARKKQIVVEYELSGQKFAIQNRGMYGWKELAKFPDTPEGSENAIQYAEAYHKIAPHLRIQVVTK